MLKKITTLLFLPSVAIGLIAGYAYGQRPKAQNLTPEMFESVLCTDVQSGQELLESIDESPVFIGKIQRSDSNDKVANGVLIVTMNSKTKSWTVFEVFESKEICVLQSGEGGRSVTQSLVI